jgi:uroporphyrinogen-III synthase
MESARRGKVYLVGAAGWSNVSIGGTTSELLRNSGVDVSHEAEEPTLASIVEAVRRALE